MSDNRTSKQNISSTLVERLRAYATFDPVGGIKRQIVDDIIEAANAIAALQAKVPELPVCQYCGGTKNQPGDLAGDDGLVPCESTWHEPGMIQAAERVASIALGAAGEHAEHVIELEAEVSTLRESLAEANRLLSLNVAEVERLRTAHVAAARCKRCGGHFHGQGDCTSGVADEPPAARVDEIMSGLYRRFKDWSKRGFGPDDVTWCEVKAEVLALIRASVPPAACCEHEEELNAAHSALADTWQVLGGDGCENVLIATPTLAADVAQNAARWRALMGCARIRVLGTAGIYSPNEDGYAHIGVEFWTKHETPSTPTAIEVFENFVAIAMAAQTTAACTAVTKADAPSHRGVLTDSFTQASAPSDPLADVRWVCACGTSNGNGRKACRGCGSAHETGAVHGGRIMTLRECMDAEGGGDMEGDGLSTYPGDDIR